MRKARQAVLELAGREVVITNPDNNLAVTKAGFVLQIDAPDLAMERVPLFQDMSDMEYAKLVRSACRGFEQGARRHPGRPRPAACLLGKLGRTARPRRGNGSHLAGTLPGQHGRART